MLEVADHAEATDVDKPSVVDCARDEDSPATKEALNYLFKQIMNCISEFAAQANEVPDAAIDETKIDKDSLISEYKTIIRQLKDTNKEIIIKQSKQVNSLKEHFLNLQTFVDLREKSRQKLEFTTVKLNADMVKVKQQIADYEQKTEMKSLHHSEDIHSLQKLVQRLVSVEKRDSALSMSSGGSLFKNPNSNSLRNSSHIPRENGLPASLHSLFDKPHPSRSTLPIPHFKRIEGMDSDVATVGDHINEPPPPMHLSSLSSSSLSSSSSLRDLHTFSRDDPMIVGDNLSLERARRDSAEFGRDHLRGDARRILHPPHDMGFSPRNGRLHDSGISHIEDDNEEGDRKRQKTDFDRARVFKTQTLRSTHPLNSHESLLPPIPSTASPPHIHPQYHQYIPQQQRGLNNNIKKLSNPPTSSPPIQPKIEKPDQNSQTPQNGQKKEPSEIWASEVLLAFSQGTESPTDPPSANASDVKRRLSSDGTSSVQQNNPMTGNPLAASTPISLHATIISNSSNGGNGNGSGNGSNNGELHIQDAQAAIRRMNAELTMKRSSDNMDEFSFRSSNGMPGLGPVLGGSTNLSSSGSHKKRRGKLPENATSLLKRWLLEHQQHPYPTEEEKAALATTTSLTLNQINNWFTNARRRILPKQKPGSPSSPPPSSSSSSSSTTPSATSSSSSSVQHHGGHDESHESHDRNQFHSPAHNLDGTRHNHTNTPNSPPYNNNSNFNNNSSSSSNSSSSNVHSSPLRNSTGHSLPLSLSHLTHSTPLMAQLTAQLAQRMASPNIRPLSSSPSMTPLSNTILSFNPRKSQEIKPPTTPMDTDETPTTAPHTISLTQKKDNSGHNNESDQPPSLDSLSIFRAQLLAKHSSLPKPTFSFKDSTPATTTPTLATPSSSSSSLSSSSSSSSSTTSTSSLPPPVSRPPIFPSNPLFASSPPSALSTISQLGVSLPQQSIEPSSSQSQQLA